MLVPDSHDEGIQRDPARLANNLSFASVGLLEQEFRIKEQKSQ